MAAANYDFEIEQGATEVRTFTWKTSDGTPLNLTGYTARMQIRPSVSSSEITLELTTENGGIALGGALGTVVVTMSATQTSAMSRPGVYDLELVNGPVVTRFIQGGVSVCQLSPRCFLSFLCLSGQPYDRH